jgi:pectate lyase-like protein
MRKSFLIMFILTIPAPILANMQQRPPDKTPDTLGHAPGRGPLVDVTLFGAKGDGVTDDTAAIQAAITYSCAKNAASVYFPPALSFYRVRQTQTGISTTAPVFTYPKKCTFYAVGANSGAQRPQFGTSPSVSIVVDHGVSPNPAPVFSLGEYSALENLTIIGYNEAVYIGGSNIRLINVNTSVNGATGIGTAQFPNAAEVYGGGIWYYHIGGSIASNSFTTPSFVILNDTPAQPPGIIDFEDLTLIGCGEAKSIASQTGTAGNWMFRNVSPEDCNNGFLVIDDDGDRAHHWTVISAITFDHPAISDASYSAFLKINSGPATQVRGVTINNPVIAVPNAVLVEVCQGVIQSVFAYGDGIGSSGVMTDCGGKVIGPAVVSNGTGFDIYDGSSLDTERTDLHPSGPAGALRTFLPGHSVPDSFAPIVIDARVGVGFGLPTTYGPDVSLYENSRGTLDIQIAKSFPPSEIRVSPSRGGALKTGTYEYWVASSTGGDCSQRSISTPPTVATSAVLTGDYDAVSLSWTPPIRGSSDITGFCIFRLEGQRPFWSSGAQMSALYVSGSSTTSYVDKGRMGCCFFLSPVPALKTAHRFTPTSLGINNDAPAYNLDVKGTARFTGQLTSSVSTGTPPLSVESTTPVARLTLSNHPKIYSCGTIANCEHKPISDGQVVFGSVILVAGSPSRVTVTGISPAFTSSSTYTCVLTDATAGTNTSLRVTNDSGSSFTITGQDKTTDRINYQCVGN